MDICHGENANLFILKLLPRIKVFILLSSWVKRVTGKAGKKSFCLMEKMGYKKLLVIVRSTVGVDEVPVQIKYKEVLE